MTIRAARPEETAFLSDLARRSKAHWPYPAEELDRYGPQLEVHAHDVEAGSVFVGASGNEIIGFYAVSGEFDSPRLTFLFVEPRHIGRGYGKQLWQHALRIARDRRWTNLTFYADAYAVAAFYKHQGCREIGIENGELGPMHKMRIDL